MNDQIDQPTMREILASVHKGQLERFLEEIEKSANAAHKIMADGNPETWDHEKLDQHVNTITYYSQELPAEIARSRA